MVTLALIVASAVSFFAGRMWPARVVVEPLAVKQADGAMPLKAGPWGEMEYVPMTISPPEELLPVRSLEEKGTRWFFEKCSRASYEQILARTGMTSDLCALMLDPAQAHEIDGGHPLRV